jgi:hypothetical protein
MDSDRTDAKNDIEGDMAQPDRRRPGRRHDISAPLIELLRGKSGPPLPLSEDVEDEDSLAGARGVVRLGLVGAVLWALIGFAVWILV